MDAPVERWVLPERLQRCDGASPWHRHDGAYAALVLDGGYFEARCDGRFAAQPGVALIHAPFEAHANAFFIGGARLLNLPLRRAVRRGVFAVRDADLIVRLAERSLALAADLIFEGAEQIKAQTTDWPDLLAKAIALDAGLSLGTWAESCGLAPETVSRGFRRRYGMAPKRFRLEVRVRNAIDAMAASAAPLSAIAAECGFADQAHMTRAVAQATGLAPSCLARRLRGEESPPDADR